MNALIAAADGLEVSPRRGRLVHDNLRELTVVYPYIIRYRVDMENDRVVILRVRHGMRRS